MRVKCLAVSASGLSPSHLAVGYTPQSKFDLTVDDNYIVYGICVSKGIVKYLLDAHVPSRPKWYPAALFQVLDDRMPPTWHFGHWGDESYDVTALWGYEELVREEPHFDRLAEEDTEAIRVFIRRKEEAQALESR